MTKMYYSLENRILWVVWTRVIFLSVMAGSSLTLNRFYGDTISEPVLWAIFWGIIFSLLSRFAMALLKERNYIFILAHLQIFADALLAGVLVDQTGGLSSAFTLLFGLNILAAGVILFGQGSLTALFYSILAFSWISFREHGVAIANEIEPLLRFFLVNSLLLLVGSVAALLFRNRSHLISRLEKSTAELASLSRLQDLLVEKIPLGLFFTQKSQIQFENPEARKIFSRSFMNLRIDDLPFEVPSNSQPKEVDFVDSEGQAKVLLVRSVDLKKNNRLLMIQDISETRHLEQKMRIQDKMASLGEFAAGLAHEIKNPLASVSGSIQMLQTSDSSEEQKMKLMRIILRETDRLDRLLTDFLNYAKPGQIRIESIAVAEIIKEVKTLIENQQAAHLISFNLQLPDDLFIEADGLKIRQLVWNLVRNAVDAISDRGTINLRVMDLNDRILIEVEDTGRGIDREIYQFVYQPFFTKSENGTGLGLALVHQIVKEHRGEVGFSSEKNKGTKFWVELPKKFNAEERGVA